MGIQKDFLRQSRYRNILLSNWVTFGLLVVFIMLAFGIEKLLQPTFTPAALLIVGVIMSLVPAFLWLAFFYRQDHLEPEPKGLVFEVFILGGLLAAAVGIPIVEFFRLPGWLYNNAGVNILGAILVIGFVQEFLKFAAVRFSVYNLPEFDELTDGVLYGTAAGLGFAVILNISFVVSSDGVNLGMGAIRIVLTSLAQASFAGITGYFLAREKFDHQPAWWVPAGVTLAAVLNGIFFYLYGVLSRGKISISAGYVNPWIGLGIALVIAVATTSVLSWLVERDHQRILKAREA